MRWSRLSNFYSNGPIPSIEDIGERLIDPIKEGPIDIIEGILPRQGQVLLAGETNVGKSLLALEICSALVTGEPLWGELKPTIQAKKILYVLGEHYNDVIKRLWAHTGLPMTDQVWLAGPEQLGYDKWLVTNGKQNPVGIEKLTKWAENTDLIVFDPLAAFASGAEIENDNAQMRLVLDSLSIVAQKTGASSLILAHMGKPSIGPQGQENSRKSYAIRGASAIEDAATNIFYFNKAEGGSAAAADTKDSKVYTLRCRKYKGVAQEEYKLMRNSATLRHTLLGSRPFVEVRKIEAQAKLSRMMMTFPDMKTADVIKIMAAMEGVSDDTIRRYLNG